MSLSGGFQQQVGNLEVMQHLTQCMRTPQYLLLASEASPTLGCSIEISRDIYMSVCRMSVVCQINCVGGITCGPRACLKSFFGI